MSRLGVAGKNVEMISMEKERDEESERESVRPYVHLLPSRHVSDLVLGGCLLRMVMVPQRLFLFESLFLDLLIHALWQGIIFHLTPMSRSQSSRSFTGQIFGLSVVLCFAQSSKETCSVQKGESTTMTTAGSLKQTPSFQPFSCAA